MRNGVPEELKDEMSWVQLPRYVWVTEFSLPADVVDLDPCLRRVRAHVVVDATGTAKCSAYLFPTSRGCATNSPSISEIVPCDRCPGAPRYPDFVPVAGDRLNWREVSQLLNWRRVVCSPAVPTVAASRRLTNGQSWYASGWISAVRRWLGSLGVARDH